MYQDPDLRYDARGLRRSDACPGSLEGRATRGKRAGRRRAAGRPTKRGCVTTVESLTYPSFDPPLRTLMGPGPSDVPPRVLEAMARPTIGHLDPQFVRMMDELKQLLRYAFQTTNEVTFPVSGPGSVGMETCFVNLVEPGDTVVVCRNGVFGARMLENVTRVGGVPVVVDDDWGTPVSCAKVESALKEHPDAKVLAFVQAETSTGAHTDPGPLVTLAHDHDCLTIVDTVTALGGVPVLVDEWDADAVYSGSQKCLSCPPGLSPVTFGERAVERVKARTTPCQSWFMDLSLQLGYWSSDTRVYHHTAPVNALYGLHEALRALAGEGLEASWQRHRTNHRALVAGFEVMGLPMLVEAPDRLPQLNMVVVPQGVDEAAVRSRLLNEYDLEVGAGLGALAGKVWRVGLMGYTCRPVNVVKCLRAFAEVLGPDVVKVSGDEAEVAAKAVYGAAWAS
jgi:alanine-glyoxylate transaminase / serine-glyoxylate transaminase / serine-pyruvate transaminase